MNITAKRIAVHTAVFVFCVAYGAIIAWASGFNFDVRNSDVGAFIGLWSCVHALIQLGAHASMYDWKCK